MTNSKREQSESQKNGANQFGTFGGVFTPCVLTILGVIMFMRAGFVSGYSGLWAALIILGIAKLITTLTTLSISAIATNLDMRVGGVYFMISRVLGPDFGGSIGITLFIANAVGVAFYTIGFTEALLSIFSVTSPVVNSLVSTVVVSGLFFLTFKGADLVIKTQYFVLAILLISIASFLIGGFMDFDAATLKANMSPASTAALKNNMGSGGAEGQSGIPFSFWFAFAIFFPAATGITAGANMSGDLKNPAKSIPWGTLAAIGFTLVIYTLQIVLMAGSVKRGTLISDSYGALKSMSLWAPLVFAGVFAATLSSALGSFLGAPRILQAMGQDRLMKAMVFFGKGSGESNEPRRATVLTFIIALLVIWLPTFLADKSGKSNALNDVAEVISMFFLIAYGMINLSAFVESKSANPSFRPRFKAFHWVTALAGAIGCGVAMIKINETYALVALAITAVIYFYLKKRDIQTSFGDAKRGYIFQRTRDNLLYLEQAKAHPKNWRPILVVVTEAPRKEAQLVRVGSWIECQRGLYTVAHMATRPDENLVQKVAARDSLCDELRRQLEADGIVAFSEAVVVDDYFKGLSTFLQSYSIGGLRPNTMLTKLPEKSQPEEREHFLKTMDVLSTFNLNLVVLKPGDIAPLKRRRTIDLWWRGEKNGSLMSLFAYLITLDKTWANSNLRILRIVHSDSEEYEARQHLERLKEMTRISARIEIIKNPEAPLQIIANTSGPVADLVLLGMAASSGEEVRKFFDAIEPILEVMPTTLFVWSNGDADVFA